MDYNPGPTPPNSSRSSNTSVESNGTSADATSSLAAGTEGSFASCADIRRTFWPIRGIDGAIISITITTDISLKTDLRPKSGSCDEYLPMLLTGSPTDQLPIMLAELGEVLPSKALTDHDIYKILQLGLGKAMSKKYSDGLREGMGSVRIKRPNRGRAAKILRGRIRYYASWKTTRGRMYQLFGTEGVLAGLDNRMRGQIPCVIQNDDASGDQIFALPAFTSMTVCKQELGANQQRRLNTSSEAIASACDDDSRRIKSLSSVDRLLLDSQSHLEVANDSTMTALLDEATHTHSAAEVTGQGHQTLDHLQDLGARFPSSSIWPCLAQGERRRKNTVSPMDYLMPFSKAEPGIDRAALTALPGPASPDGADLSWDIEFDDQFDQTDSILFGNKPAFDFGGLSSESDSKHAPAMDNPYVSYYKPDMHMADCDLSDFDPGNMGGLPILDEYFCEQNGAAETGADLAAMEGLTDDFQLPWMGRRHSA